MSSQVEQEQGHQTPRRDRSADYDLKVEPDGRSWTARENLTDVLQRELVGPSRGDAEEIEASPDSLYILGRIAPAKLQRSEEDPGDADADPDDQPTDIGDAEDARQSTGVPVTAVDDSSADSDTDDVDDQPQKRGLMIPASMGLRFQIPDDLESFTVRASWATYEPFKTERVDPKGNPVRAYRRIPREEAVRVELNNLTAGTTKDYPVDGEITLRVDVYPDAARRRQLVEVALCNDRETPRKIPVNAWMFQTQLYIEADRDEAFLPVTDPMDPQEDDFIEADQEMRRLDLQYRNRLEFAIGRTCSVDWHSRPGARRASKVWTTWLPIVETPQVDAQEVTGALLDMRQLADASLAELKAGLEPIADGYTAWLKARSQEATSLPEHLADVAAEAIEDAEAVRDQLREGIEFLSSDEEAQRCFRFMNRAMADQRIHSQVVEERKDDSNLDLNGAESQVLAKGPRLAHSWRMFQLAFILMQIKALTCPATDRRSRDTLAKVELLFFPTGGGKTEAYLGLAAYTFAIRRRQGLLHTPDGDLDGRAGVSVLMRYTLRLLTSQQFQRATTLICAAELLRAQEPVTWGNEPFRIGLWVGLDVTPKRYQDAESQLVLKDGRYKHRLTVLQIQRCPWCGTPISREHVRADAGVRRIRVYCGDDLGNCPFSEGGAVDDGLPVLTVDEEIYRLVPALVIATVDKFARLAREGEAAALFGYVAKRCERHGYVHPDFTSCTITDGNKHRAKDGLPAAAVRPAPRLRPPDLIIQDELHLITGALGTTVGLFEAAVEVMTSWNHADGPVKPLIVASTATVRNAGAQIKGLYGRGVTLFPPQVLDVADTFFSREVPIDEEHPGRRYIGASTTGVRLTSAEIKVAEILMAGAQLLIDRSGAAADPYMTLVGYFNATRELAGMARYMADDIQGALAKGWKSSQFPLRYGSLGSLQVAELTARVGNSDITRTLDQLANRFDPDRDSTAGRKRLIEQFRSGQERPRREVIPYDAVLATSMLQVGVDVSRLGLMMMVGQPKNTAEYIQASSRVGRSASRPGLVVTLGNWARPRDLAHYEQFRHYHETFYARVEPLSVTPLSITSLERGLDGVLVSAARVLQAARLDGLSPERNAGRIDTERAHVEEIIEALVARLDRASRDGSGADIDYARNRLANRLGIWSRRRAEVLQTRRALVYERALDMSKYVPLIISAEEGRARTGAYGESPFVIANSMREVQPEINLLVSPDPSRLFTPDPPSAPNWTAKTAED